MSGRAVTIATWNVNSVRKRLQGIRWLADEVHPDILCLQETKVENDLFPADEIRALGYPHLAFDGIKGYNGVAILSKVPLRDVETREWCAQRDARHIFARADLGGEDTDIELHSLYVPAGGDKPDPVVNPKFAHKLAFLTELTHWWAARGAGSERRLMMGDFNVAPLPTDVWSHTRLRNTVTHTEIEIRHLEDLRRAARWTDIVRKFHPPAEPVYTWWSYRAADWEAAGRGRRLDHAWASPGLMPDVSGVRICRETRDWDPPSDHVPVIVDVRV